MDACGFAKRIPTGRGKVSTRAAAALRECPAQSATPAMESIRRRCRPVLSKTTVHDPETARSPARRCPRVPHRHAGLFRGGKPVQAGRDRAAAASRARGASGAARKAAPAVRRERDVPADEGRGLMSKIRINKMDAARRQIDAAIRMTFFRRGPGRDPFRDLGSKSYCA
jgi:hypothetical protein